MNPPVQEGFFVFVFLDTYIRPHHSSFPRRAVVFYRQLLLPAASKRHFVGWGEIMYPRKYGLKKSVLDSIR